MDAQRRKGEGVSVQPLPVLGQPAAAVEPGYGPLNDPTLGQDDEPARVGAFDDLDVDLLADAGQPVLKIGDVVVAKPIYHG